MWAIKKTAHNALCCLQEKGSKVPFWTFFKTVALGKKLNINAATAVLANTAQYFHLQQDDSKIMRRVCNNYTLQ